MSSHVLNGVTWVGVTSFNLDSEDEQDRVGRIHIRLTKQGRVNLHDLNRWFKDTGHKVPLRYTSGGIRKRNPDVGWPDWCLLEGDPPEEYWMLPASAICELRENILEHHPAKMTEAETEWIVTLERDMLRGQASEADVSARVAFLAEIARRPVPDGIDEW